MLIQPRTRGGLRSALMLFLLGMLAVAVIGCGDESASGAQAPDGEAPAADAEPAKNADGADEAEEAKPEKKKKKKRERATSVTASPVVLGDLVIPVVAEGSVRARQSADIKFELGGQVVDIWVEEGQRVAAGEPLAGLDDREYRLQREEARARYLQALGQLAVEEEGHEEGEAAEHDLTEQLEALDKLEDEGVITRRQRLDRELELGMGAVRQGAYRRELLEVRSGLANARADAERAELTLERTVVRAPFGGVISDLDCSPGESVSAGERLGRLVDDINIEAELGVLESDLGSIKRGDKALLTIPALDETRELKVDVISPDVNDESRTCRVLLRLKSKDGRVKPGMFVRAAIAGRVLPGRTLVPRAAILTRDGRPVLFKIDDGRAKWVYVQLGARNDHLVEIARVDQGGPLEPGTLVIVDNHLTLTHDAKVKVKKTTPTADPWIPAEQG